MADNHEARFLLPAGSCVVPCVRDEPPIVHLTLGEARFQDTLWTLVQTRDGDLGVSVCHVVSMLEDMVRTGSVVRHRAAVLSNVMSFCSGSAVGLLWYVLLHTHLEVCQHRCVDKVLAWGVCPHVRCSFGWAEPPRMSMYGFKHGLRRPLSLQLQETLYAYGALPWSHWNRTGVYEAPSHYEWERCRCRHVVLQWRRWHVRGQRRLWVLLTA